MKRVAELKKLKLMQPAGLAAFEARDVKKFKKQSAERQAPELDEELDAQFRKNYKAWTFFESQPPSYRKAVIFWISSAKKLDTRLRRLNTVIEKSKKAQRIDMMSPGK